MGEPRCCVGEAEGRGTFFFPWFSAFFTVFFIVSVCNMLEEDQLWHDAHSHHEHPIHTTGQKKNASTRQREWQEFRRVKETVFHTVFRKLRDEHSTFRSRSGALSVLRGPSQRRAFCGGWETDIPSLVLRSLHGHRCPPVSLL